jgi:methionyl-tRNA synthetase
MFGPQVWSPFGLGLFGSVFFLVAALWLLFTIVLKGYALWHSAKRAQIWWFVALLIFNTLGILELVYIVFFLKKWPGKADATHHEHHDSSSPHHEHHHAV